MSHIEPKSRISTPKIIIIIIIIIMIIIPYDYTQLYNGKIRYFEMMLLSHYYLRKLRHYTRLYSITFKHKKIKYILNKQTKRNINNWIWACPKYMSHIDPKSRISTPKIIIMIIIIIIIIPYDYTHLYQGNNHVFWPYTTLALWFTHDATSYSIIPDNART